MVPLTGTPRTGTGDRMVPAPVRGCSGQSPTKLVKRSTPMVLYMERT